MQKQKAIELLGGSISAAAEAIGVSYQAVFKWPDELPDAIRDRVQAALFRKQGAESRGKTHQSSLSGAN